MGLFTKRHKHTWGKWRQVTQTWKQLRSGQHFLRLAQVRDCTGCGYRETEEVRQ